VLELGARELGFEAGCNAEESGGTQGKKTALRKKRNESRLHVENERVAALVSQLVGDFAY
jgi:hypothetical protein